MICGRFNLGPIWLEIVSIGRYSCRGIPVTIQVFNRVSFIWSWPLVSLSLGVFWYISLRQLLQTYFLLWNLTSLCNFSAYSDAANTMYVRAYWKSFESWKLQVPFPFSKRRIKCKEFPDVWATANPFRTPGAVLTIPELQETPSSSKQPITF